MAIVIERRSKLIGKVDHTPLNPGDEIHGEIRTGVGLSKILISLVSIKVLSDEEIEIITKKIYPGQDPQHHQQVEHLSKDEINGIELPRQKYTSLIGQLTISILKYIK